MHFSRFSPISPHFFRDKKKRLQYISLCSVTTNSSRRAVPLLFRIKAVFHLLWYKDKQSSKSCRPSRLLSSLDVVGSIKKLERERKRKRKRNNKLLPETKSRFIFRTSRLNGQTIRLSQTEVLRPAELKAASDIEFETSLEESAER